MVTKYRDDGISFFLWYLCINIYETRGATKGRFSILTGISGH
jgi:hypothetical protein